MAASAPRPNHRGARQLAVQRLKATQALATAVPRVDVDDQEETSAASRDADAGVRSFSPPLEHQELGVGRVVHAVGCAGVFPGMGAIACPARAPLAGRGMHWYQTPPEPMHV